MPQVKIRYNFYEARCINPESIVLALRAIIQMSQQDRTQTDYSSPVEMDEIEESGNFFYGNFARVRMDNIPHRKKVGGPRRDVPLDDDEGLGEDTAFAYHVPSRTFVIQKPKYGAPTATALCRYLVAKGEDLVDLELIPRIRKDAMVRLAQMKQITKLRVQLAGAPNLTIEDIPETSSEDTDWFFSTFDFLKAPEVLVELNARKSEKKLDKNLVQKILKAVWPFTKNDSAKISVHSLKIGGNGEDDKTDVIDFLSEVLHSVEIVDHGKRHRIPYCLRKDGLKSAWMKTSPDFLG